MLRTRTKVICATPYPLKKAHYITRHMISKKRKYMRINANLFVYRRSTAVIRFNTKIFTLDHD